MCARWIAWLATRKSREGEHGDHARTSRSVARTRSRVSTRDALNAAMGVVGSSTGGIVGLAMSSESGVEASPWLDGVDRLVAMTARASDEFDGSRYTTAVDLLALVHGCFRALISLPSRLRPRTPLVRTRLLRAPQAQ